MAFNTIPMLQQNVRAGLDELLTLVESEEAGAWTADEMERHLFRQMLQLGAHLMQLFLDYRAQVYPREAVQTAEGGWLPYHSEKARVYHCLFGKLTCRRPYFYRRDQGGYSPLDAALGLPADSYSDCLRELYEELNVDLAYEKTAQILGRFLGIALSKRAQQQLVATDAGEVDEYYEQLPPPPVAEEAEILVAQADGKGVPLVRPTQYSQQVRMKRGEARSRKKAVLVTALYTIAAAPRTPEQVLASLLAEDDDTAPEPPERHHPRHKQIRGTLHGKEVALARQAQAVAKREGPHIKHRVALCDGDVSLQTCLQAHLPRFTLVLDFIHAYEHLWKAGNCLYDEQASAERLSWVTAQAQLLLNSQTGELIDRLRRLAAAPERTTYQQRTLSRLANYYEKNQAYMDYATYLARGWPIASGVIEGACRHFVKDRLERSGMRWTEPGVENLLRLRAVAENGDWADYHRHRKEKRQQRLYQTPWPALLGAELAAPPTPQSVTQPPAKPPATQPSTYAALPLAA